jgi:Uma2 family endonuclease
MSPIGPPHSSTVQKLNALLLPPLLERATVRIQSPFAASDTSEPEPDVAIVPIGDYDTEHPTQAYLVIEVADSSLQRDRDIKQRIYAQAGVPEYWIVNTAEKCIEVYRTPRAEGYLTRERVTDDGSVSLPNFADVQVQVRDLMPKSQPTAS